MNQSKITVTEKFPSPKVHTSIGSVKPRTNNPTYSSSFMSASLCSVSPPSNYGQKLLKETSYRSQFNKGLNQSVSWHLNSNPFNYKRFSKDALEKKRSNLSSYGANLLK